MSRPIGEIYSMLCPWPRQFSTINSFFLSFLLFLFPFYTSDSYTTRCGSSRNRRFSVISLLFTKGLPGESGEGGGGEKRVECRRRNDAVKMRLEYSMMNTGMLDSASRLSGANSITLFRRGGPCSFPAIHEYGTPAQTNWPKRATFYCLNS